MHVHVCLCACVQVCLHIIISCMYVLYVYVHNVICKCVNVCGVEEIGLQCANQRICIGCHAHILVQVGLFI